MGNPADEAAAAYHEFEAKPEVAGPPWAGFWLRVEARLWDWAVLNTSGVVLVCAAALANALGATSCLLLLWVLIYPLVVLVYFVAMTWRWGQTLGKMQTGIRVVTGSGEPPGMGDSIGRLMVEVLLWVVGWIVLGLALFVISGGSHEEPSWARWAFLAGAPLLCVDYLWVGLSRQKRSLHDMAAGTYVVRVRPRRRQAEALLLVPVLAAGLGASPLMRAKVVEPFYIPSDSMNPTLRMRDRVFCNKLTLRLRPPRNGDIIVFTAPRAALFDDKPKDFIKRVVGIPGDHLQVKRGKLWRNGQAVDEPYIREPITYLWPEGVEKGKEVVVPPGQLVVLGDNRDDSNDSHHWHVEAGGKAVPKPFLPLANVQGVIVCRFWPPGRIGPVE